MRLFNQDQRALLSDKLLDLANLAAGALVFGQFLTKEDMHAWVLVIGVMVVGVLYSYSLYLRKHPYS